HVARNDADYHGDADRNRKSDGQTGHVDRRDKKEIRKVEDSAAGKRVDEIRAIRRANVVQKTRGIVRSIAHRKGQRDRDQENAKSIVPVKQFETVVLYAFIGVGPGAPTDRTGEYH